ncbi:MAG: T9SS type A sorting domain-containing protein [Lewinella sp.]|nr:T9SS type A sorting domain-containing protein [Lewinella sp.]
MVLDLDFDLFPSATAQPVAGFDLKLFPNPGRDFVHLEVQSPLALNQLRLQLVNNSGQLVYVGAMDVVVGQNRLRLDVQDLPSGMYLLRVMDQQQKLLGRRELIISR